MHVLHRKPTEAAFGIFIPYGKYRHRFGTQVRRSLRVSRDRITCKVNHEMNVFIFDRETLLLPKEEDDSIRFALSYSKVSEEDAINKLKKAMEADVENESKKRSAFEKLPKRRSR